jgi:UDP-N-acetyl-D-glucosamine dehydrogenase
MGAEVRGADPFVVEEHGLDNGIIRVDLTQEEVTAADVVVLLSDHDVFDLAMVSANARLVLDCRHRMTGDNVEHL